MAVNDLPTQKSARFVNDLPMQKPWFVYDFPTQKFGVANDFPPSSMVPGGGDKSPPARMWTWDVKDTLVINIHEAGKLSKDRESFRKTVMRATNCQEFAT